MNAICDDLESKVNKAMENKHLLHMFTIEKGLVYYLHAISSNGRAGRLRRMRPRWIFPQKAKNTSMT